MTTGPSTDVMDTFLQDIRYGIRMLFKNKAFTLVAMITLALGIGANTAIFSLVYSLLLRTLPYPNSDRIFFIQNADPQGNWPVSEPEFVEFRDQSKAFQSMAAVNMDWVSITGSGEPLRVMAMIPSASLDSVLGVQPAKGRWFTAEEDRSGKDRVVVISDGLWKRTLGSDPSILGKSIRIDDVPRTIVGIMPAGFQFMDNRVEVWLPLAIEPSGFDKTAVENHNREAVGRLRSGINPHSAEQEMTGIVQTMNEKYPGHYTKKDRAHLEPVRNVLVGDIRTPLLLLLGAVGFVLLIACANVANLFLARGEARQKEIAIRTALGASSARIVRLLFVESILLALLGGAAGLAIAFWGLDALMAISPVDFSGLQEIKIDPQVLGFTVLISVLSGILFGLAPAFQMAFKNVQSSLKDNARGTTSGVRGSRVRRLLVVSEIALAVVLVIGAGLLIKSFYNLREVSPGFDPKNVLLIRFDLPMARYHQTTQSVAFYRQLLERINALPSVESSAITIFIPLFNSDSNWGFEMEGRTQEGVKSAFYNMGSPDYFKTLRIPLIKGRYFSKQDQEKPEGAVIINEKMAKRYWPNESPIGKRINVNLGPAVWREIVGVVGDVRNSSLSMPVDSQMYFPLIEAPFASVNMGSLVVRTSSNPLTLVKPVEAQIRSMDPNLPFAQVRTMEGVVSLSVSQPRFTVALLGLFASIAMLLAAVGIYGVISYSVAQRTHEIGVRVALGARRKEILKLVVGQGLRLAAIGIAIGLIAAVILTRVMSSLLFEVSSTDPATFVLIAILLGGVALISSYIPARRAAKVDPMVALRYE